MADTENTGTEAPHPRPPVAADPGRPAVIRVSIFHNVSYGSRFTVWTPEAAMALVDEYDVPAAEVQGEDVDRSVDRLLGRVWREQNVVDGHERPAKLGHRSLSVGDVVQLCERAFAVQSIGWRPIDPAAIRRAAAVTIHVDPRLLSSVAQLLAGVEQTADLLAAGSPLNSEARHDWHDVAEAIYLARAAARARAAKAEDGNGPGVGAEQERPS
jgi:hypothetical protein